MDAFGGRSNDFSYKNWLSRCPDTINGNHSPLDSDGKCTWCGRKVGHTTRKWLDHKERSQLDEFYARYYDPDY